METREESAPEEFVPEFSSDDIVADRYEIVRCLGNGAMGTVYLAKDRLLEGLHVALKILHRALVREPNAAKRFIREAELMHRVNHRNVVRTFDVGIYEELHYFTMEYVEGGSLDVIDRARLLEPEYLAEVITQISQGLSAIHAAEIVHRDLKPENILVTKEGLVKISDFGVARKTSSTITQNNVIMGSVAYMAPEIWNGDPTGPESDLYALGVILYEAISGQFLFDSESLPAMMSAHLTEKPRPLTELEPATPRWANRLVLKLLEKRPVDRFKNAAEIITFIREQFYDSGPGGVSLDGGGDAKSQVIFGELPSSQDIVEYEKKTVEERERIKREKLENKRRLKAERAEKKRFMRLVATCAVILVGCVTVLAWQGVLYLQSLPSETVNKQGSPQLVNQNRIKLSEPPPAQRMVEKAITSVSQEQFFRSAPEAVVVSQGAVTQGAVQQPVRTVVVPSGVSTTQSNSFAANVLSPSGTLVNQPNTASGTASIPQAGGISPVTVPPVVQSSTTAAVQSAASTNEPERGLPSTSVAPPTVQRQLSQPEQNAGAESLQRAAGIARSVSDSLLNVPMFSAVEVEGLKQKRLDKAEFESAEKVYWEFRKTEMLFRLSQLTDQAKFRYQLSTELEEIKAAEQLIGADYDGLARSYRQYQSELAEIGQGRLVEVATRLSESHSRIIPSLTVYREAVKQAANATDEAKRQVEEKRVRLQRIATEIVSEQIGKVLPEALKVAAAKYQLSHEREIREQVLAAEALPKNVGDELDKLRQQLTPLDESQVFYQRALVSLGE